MRAGRPPVARFPPPWPARWFGGLVSDVTAELGLLSEKIPDLHTRLKIFAQYSANKLTHLLGADIMHNLPLDYDPAEWEDWDGFLGNDFVAVLT